MSAKKKTASKSPFDALKGLKDKLAAEEDARRATAPAQRAPSPRKAAAAPAPAAEPEDDALTFHRMMNGVKPLDHTTTRIPKSQGSIGGSEAGERAKQRNLEGHAIAEREANEVHEHLRALVEDEARFEVSDDGRRVEGRRTELPIDALRKLRRGLIPIDARLDLHGMRAEEARVAMETFLRDQRVRGERCVLVVHGKGVHSPGGSGVLRGEISAWLSQGRASEHVGAFATATLDDGGEGAVYVLLRR